MDQAIFIAIAAILVVLGGLWSLARSAGLVALIRLADQCPEENVWRVWKRWLRSGLSGWSLAVWRLISLQVVVWLGVTPVLIPGVVCMGAPFWGDLLTGRLLAGEPVEPYRLALSASLGLVVLLAVSVPLLVASAPLQLARRAAVLEDMGALASIRRAWEILRCSPGEVFSMWLVAEALNLVYWFVVLPLAVVLAAAGMILGWMSGAAAYLVLVQILEVETSFMVAVLAGGVVFLVVQYLPLSFLDGLMSTYLAVSWTRTYRQLCPKKVIIP